MVFDAVIIQATAPASSTGRKKDSCESVASEMSVVLFSLLRTYVRDKKGRVCLRVMAKYCVVRYNDKLPNARGQQAS
jgi:hypothetical protein